MAREPETAARSNFYKTPSGDAMTTPLVPLTIFGWIPFSLLLVASRIPIRKAIIFIFIAAWLFLPVAAFAFSGIPDLTKSTVVSYSVILAVLIFDTQRLLAFRPGWWDLPAVMLCVSALPTSIVNGLGVYDGLSITLANILTWGVPYFTGRLYLGSLQGLRQLAIGIFLGGLAYVPLCLFEVRLSPQLHRIVYGYFPHSFAQTIRYSGWRPQVFMQHGLELGLWMFAATLIGLWLWRSGGPKELKGVPLALLVPILIVTFVLAKSTGAWGLCLLGLMVLVAGTILRSSLPVYLTIGAIAFHLITNTMGTPPHTTAVVEFLRTTPLPVDRIESLKFRFDNEALLTEHAKERWLLGWGGYDRNRVYFDNGKPVVTDSLMIIYFGTRGIVGLFSFYVFLLLPVVGLVWRKCPGRTWARPDCAPAVAIAIVILMYAVDCLLNAMINPVYILATGSLAGYAFSKERAPRRRRLPVARQLRYRQAPARQLSATAGGQGGR